MSKKCAVKLFLFFALVGSVGLMSACGGSGDGGVSPTATPAPNPTITTTPIVSPIPTMSPTPTFTPTPTPSPSGYVSVYSETLDSDGPSSGDDAYTLIRNKFAFNSLESPDLYSVNHTGVLHITEDNDDIVGDHFRFVLHRDDDKDRDRDDDTRQRNEIKVFGSSDDELKGFEGTTFEYRWKFKLNSFLEVSSKFSHFFQLKAVYGDDAQPLITISGAERGGGDTLQIRYSPYTLPSDSNTQYPAVTDLDLARGEWLEVFCRATYAEAADGGKITVTITRMSDGMELLAIDEENIDMWRGPESGETPFVRPKWGYYRSLEDASSLRVDEEDVRFANFQIDRVEFVGD